MTDRPPRVVRRPLLAAALTLLKLLFQGHRFLLQHNSVSHPPALLLPPTSERSDDGNAPPTITDVAVFAGSPTPDPTPDFSPPETPSDPGPLPIVEMEVRATLRALIERDEALTPLAPDMVSDADIQEACRTVAGWCRLEVKRETALFYAATTAIQIAERRLGVGA